MTFHGTRNEEDAEKRGTLGSLKSESCNYSGTESCRPTRGWNRPPLHKRAGSKIKPNLRILAGVGLGLRPGGKAHGVFVGVYCILILHEHSRSGGSAPGRWAAKKRIFVNNLKICQNKLN